MLPDKEDFYSKLNMEGIADADYMHAKRVKIDFKIKNLAEYHDLYVQSDTLLLTSAFSSLFFIRYWISMASMFKKKQE